MTTKIFANGTVVHDSLVLSPHIKRGLGGWKPFTANLGTSAQFLVTVREASIRDFGSEVRLRSLHLDCSAVYQYLRSAGHDHGCGYPDTHNGIRPQVFGLLDQAIERLLPRLGHHLRIVGNLSADNTAQTGHDIPAHMSGPDSIALHQSIMLHYLLARNIA